MRDFNDRKVRKAIVLAAGFGTRLRPFTCAVPKPLLPVWGEPMLARVVDRLRSLGVEEIVVNCHHLHEQVEAWCAANGCRAAFEPEILGTGGVLNPLREWIGGDDFYLVNGDIVLEGFDGFGNAALGVRGAGGAGAVAFARTAGTGPRTIEVEPHSGFVTNWSSDDAGFPGTFTYCGFALLSAKIFDYIEPTGFSSIIAAYERAMGDGWFVKAVSPKGMLWTDAGSIDSYLDVNRHEDDNAFADIPQLKATVGDGDGAVEFLGARGSDRAFFRRVDRIAIVYDDAKRAENALYVTQARWLKEHGIPVPAVLADRPDLKAMAMEWGGEERKMSLADRVRVVEELAKFNALGARWADSAAEGLPPLMEAFGPETWAWERGLFAEHCLDSRFRHEMPAAVETELKAVADRLEREPKALVHRDFQSSNVLWKGDEPCFIDFQGMRLGPAAYDLASFVYDPYVDISEREREALALKYAQVSGREDIVGVLPFAAVQRLVQCLGAFGRLASVGQPQFGKFVLPALERLLAAADEANLDATGALAEDLIAEEGHHHHHHK